MTRANQAATSARQDTDARYRYPPTSEDWQRIRPVLTRLYQDEKRTLAAIIADVNRQYGFRASSRLFKRRFAEWGIERKFKNREVRYMLVMEHIRRSSGKGTKFLLHGRQVPSEDIRRYVRRKQMKVSEVLEDFSNGQILPCEWIQCQTPRSTSPHLFTTRQHKLMDGLFCAWKKLILGSIDEAFCYPGDTGLVWKYEDGSNNSIIFRAFEVFQDFLHYSRASMGAREMLLLRRGCLLMEDVVSCSNFLWWIGVAGVVAVLVHTDGLARAKLEMSSPHSFFLRQLTSVPLEQFVSVTTQLFTILIEMEHDLRPGNSYFTWQSRVDLWTFNRRHRGGSLSSDTFQLLQEGIANFGPGPENKMRELLIDEAFWLGFDPKAWYSAECRKENLPLLDWDQPFDDPIAATAHDLSDPFPYMKLGCESFNKGDFLDARSYWTAALTLPTDSTLALENSSVHYVLDYLDYLSTESEVADGNLYWRDWKSEIEDTWQRELDLACHEKTTLSSPLKLGFMGESLDTSSQDLLRNAGLVRLQEHM